MNDWCCLAIETATEHASVAVAAAGAVYTRELAQNRNNSRELYRSVQELLSEAGIGLADLDCVACGAGPGSFTGVRVAIAATQGLGYALQVPVIGVSTLAALAQAAVEQGGTGYIAPCLDARMGELYVGIYECRCGELPRAVASDQLVGPDAVGILARDEPVLGVGAGWQAYPLPPRAGIRLAGFSSLTWPTARAVLALAKARYFSGERTSPAQLAPTYLRGNVVAKTGS